jgi:pilus assembly protein CpaF
MWYRRSGCAEKEEMDIFYLDQYLKENSEIETDPRTRAFAPDFDKLCLAIREAFALEWEAEGNSDLSSATSLQKRAIIGYENETAYFKEKIKRFTENFNAAKTVYPKWYESLDDAIFHENWGLAGIAEWFAEKYRGSSSAKIIGDRIFFLNGGRMELMPQRISGERKDQLIKAFLLLTPEERLDKEFHEVYLLDGTRITIFRGAMTKPSQDVIVFRRYIIPRLSFEEQASRKTIPAEAIPLFRAMVETGFNVVFLGQIRSAKTTFLSTWQSYEDPLLEGVQVETDPEIPMHQLMPVSDCIIV